MNLDALNAVHARFQHLLARVGGHVDGIFICPHTPGAGCDCREPRPRLLLSITKRFGVEIAGVPVISSRENDLQAARSAEAVPYLIASQRVVSAKQVLTFNDLQHAVEHLLSEAT
jgi:D-glycero-D-manno-heptose 1,7-bisphosphate phosphatase